jgi:hypothetical protein
MHCVTRRILCDYVCAPRCVLHQSSVSLLAPQPHCPGCWASCRPVGCAHPMLSTGPFGLQVMTVLVIALLVVTGVANANASMNMDAATSPADSMQQRRLQQQTYVRNRCRLISSGGCWRGWFSACCGTQTCNAATRTVAGQRFSCNRGRRACCR